MNKEQLAAAAAKGDEQAFLQLMNSQREQMLRVALAYLHNEEDALEALQETVCRAWLKKHSLRKPQFMTTWLIRILIRVCTDELRHRKRAVSRNMAEAEGNHTISHNRQVKDDAGTVVDRLDIEEAVKGLEEPYRGIIILKYYKDMTITDIADVMQRPDGTIRTWLHKALKQLRVQIGGSEGGRNRP